jgi:hypothetical protein
VGPTLAAALGSFVAYGLYSTLTFHLAYNGWTIFPLAAVFAGAGGWALSIMLMRFHQQE